MLKYLLAVAVLVASHGCRSPRPDPRAPAEANTIFGFTMGMTKQQVADRLPRKSEFRCDGDFCNAVYLPHGFDTADEYHFWFGKRGEGLYQILVLASYGYETRRRYDALKAELSGVFGEPHEDKQIADSPDLSIFLKWSEQKLSAEWGRLPEGPLADRNLAFVGLVADIEPGGFHRPIMINPELRIGFVFENIKAVKAAESKARFGQ